ncbi:MULTISPECIES: energy transducer TonB [unclassified Oceanobacter]|uniref:energy transducer TonB n=1 Tax=unclassified Oceanobacter TaxID=2620260 RepID=UPI002735C39E|nr:MULTISPECIES: energy transducer TonB [unclassified Oceanobacter]MDP2610387.1 TonB family protein [Oceanobacter sp. 1_MG-2023]MDP2613603.1 TonB family protein [Oceanobacter sp. 2_MG-2023]
MPAAVVSSSDRLSFALFLALLLHAMIVLGVSFRPDDRSNLSKTLEVTLASYRSDKAPEEADFLAQENQEGSGTEEEARMLTTDVEAPFQSNDITPASVQKQEVSAPKALANTPARITTTAASPNQAVSSPDKQPPVEAKPVPEGPPKMLLQRSLEMASLEAKLDSMRQAYAKRPRVQRLTAASTMKASDAYYVNTWRSKIEKMGTLNYPKEAENCFDNCRLRVLVSINPNGTIHNLEVLESSGRKVLDDAALRIVRMSAPFAPFTEEMRKNTDLLEIIRTWQFKGNRYLSEGS